MCAVGFLLEKEKFHGKWPTVDTSLDFCDIEDMTGVGQYLIEDIVNANDDLYGEERRKELRKLFKQAGYRLTFV